MIVVSRVVEEGDVLLNVELLLFRLELLHVVAGFRQEISTPSFYCVVVQVIDVVDDIIESSVIVVVNDRGRYGCTDVNPYLFIYFAKKT